MKTCRVKLCQRETSARGLCKAHYHNATARIYRGKDTWETIEKRIVETGTFVKKVYSKLENEILKVDENMRREAALKRMPSSKYAHILFEDLNPGKNYKDYLKEKNIKLFEPVEETDDDKLAKALEW